MSYQQKKSLKNTKRSVFDSQREVLLTGSSKKSKKSKSRNDDSYCAGGNPFRNTNKGVYLVKKSLNYDDRFMSEEITHYDLVEGLLKHNPMKSTINREEYVDSKDPFDLDEEEEEEKAKLEAISLINDWQKKETDQEYEVMKTWLDEELEEIENKFEKVSEQVKEFDYIINDNIDDQLLASINSLNSSLAKKCDKYYDRVSIRLDQVKTHDVTSDLMLDFDFENEDIDQLLFEYPILDNMIKFYLDVTNFNLAKNYDKVNIAFLASGSGKTFLMDEYPAFFYDIDALLDWDGGDRKLKFLIKYSRAKNDWSVTNNYWKELIQKYHYVYRNKVLLAHHPDQIPTKLLNISRKVIIFMSEKNIKKKNLTLENEKALQLVDASVKKVCIRRESFLFFLFTYFDLLSSEGRYFIKEKWGSKKFKTFQDTLFPLCKYFFVK